MIQITICDDQKHTITPLHDQLLLYAKEREVDMNIVYFSTPSSLYTYMHNTTVDIIFMDLEFGSQSEDGILWSTKIHREFPHTLVIILTAHENRYKEGYIARAFRFMTKAFEHDEFTKNMDACMDELQLSKTIIIPHLNNTPQIPLNEILYFVAQPGGCEIKTLSTTFFNTDSLKAWEAKMSPGIFFRSHKKYLINLYAIEKLKNHTVLLTNGEQLPVSRRKWTMLKTAYVKFDITMKNRHK